MGTGAARCLGVVKLQTPCGPAWGHDGGTPSAVNISLTSPDGSRQAALMVNRDATTWTEQIGADYSGALPAFCVEPVAPAAARPLAATMAAVLPSLQRAR